MTIKFLDGPWKADSRFTSIFCENVKAGGPAKIFDVRGWGYLTGTGHGGLGLHPDVAYEIQKANARLACAAPQFYLATTLRQNNDPKWIEAEALALRIVNTDIAVIK